MTTTPPAPTRPETYWVYAYDGSGVALRSACTVDSIADGRATIRLDNPSPEVLSIAKYEGNHDPDFWLARMTETGWLASVRIGTISTATYAPLASFNWLD